MAPKKVMKSDAPLKRPKLTAKLDAKTFGRCYWEVKELTDFCREQGLSVTGLKADKARRVEIFLQSGRKEASSPRSSSSGSRDSALPGGITLKTPVRNYNNDAITRTFFQKHCGEGFRFNDYLRGFAKAVPKGKPVTYGDLVNGWKAAEDKRAHGMTRIGKQFEYNQFARDFFAANASSGRQDMMSAWKTVRSFQGPNTYKEYKKLQKRKAS
ncbi:unnamed protein product [Symbiodinium sp. CCMP2456]|nr:unnamed protein product [Symbiodinium sp. CCMP2456]